jgi:hypothetical protein
LVYPDLEDQTEELFKYMKMVLEILGEFYQSNPEVLRDAHLKN